MSSGSKRYAYNLSFDIANQNDIQPGNAMATGPSIINNSEDQFGDSINLNLDVQHHNSIMMPNLTFDDEFDQMKTNNSVRLLSGRPSL